MGTGNHFKHILILLVRRLVLMLLVVSLLSACSMIEKMKLTRKSKAWEKRSLSPSRQMTAEERNQAWQNEWKKRRQDQMIEEQSGGILKNSKAKGGEDKAVTKKKKKSQ